MKERAVAEFVMRLMHARTDGHLMHLQTTSFSEHMALGTFYEEIGDLVDSFVEAYQGKYGIIETYPSGYTPPSDDAVLEIGGLKDFVADMRTDVPQDSELQNIIDEIAALIDGTLYKLRFLK